MANPAPPAEPIVNWRDPDYDSIWSFRQRRLAYLRKHPELIEALKLWYRDHPADFIDDWGVTIDPRNVERDLPPMMPFLLFPKQREWIDFVIRKWRDRRPGLTEKSRDSGMSWLSIALGCTLSLNYDGLVIGYGSRKEDYVDKIGDPKSLFYKARVFMAELPPEFRGGWELNRNASHLRISFPNTGSIMTGEAGDNIGRGHRTSIYFVDEAQPLDAVVMTPTGPQTMADMRVGSQVIGIDGQSHSVIGINDCGVHDVLRFSFSDGTSTECSPNHLWTVKKAWGAKRTMTLRAHEIAADYVYESPGGQVQYKYRVPVCNPVQFCEATQPLPADPYLIGALLGDGSVKSGTIRITTMDHEIIDAFDRLLPVGVVVGAFDGRYSYNIVDPHGRGRSVGGARISQARVMLKNAGIMGYGSPQKFIPDIYKYASPDDRLAILQGLMDTDGSATGGSASFYTTSIRLAQDVRCIVQSLGGTSTHNLKPDARGYKDVHAIHITLPEGMQPFRLSRKLTKLRVRKHPPGRTIVAIEHVGRRPVRCISIDAKNGLYLTDNFIVTHNSAFLERPMRVENALSQTTNCRMDISTPNGIGNPFEQKRHGGKVEVFTFHWRDDPRKDDEWYARQKEDLDPVTVAQEIDIDYSASIEGVLIPHEWVLAAVDAHTRLGIAPSGLRKGALDVADQGTDLNAFCGAYGVVIERLEEWSGKSIDIFATASRAVAICDAMNYTTFDYDADGLGASIRGDVRVLNEERTRAGMPGIIAEPFRGSGEVTKPDSEDVKGRKNRDLFGNRKAQAWWSLRDTFRRTYRWVREGVPCNGDEIISIPSSLPNFTKLVSELSQPTFTTNGAGKIIVDKQPAGSRSPNLADAVMIRFARDGKGTFRVPLGAVRAALVRGRRG